MLNKEQILAVKDIEEKKIKVPEWKGEILIKSLSSAERSEYYSFIQKRNKPGVGISEISGIYEKLIVLGVVDANGDRMFSDDDIKKLGEKSPAVLTRIANEILAISGMGPDDVDKAEENLG